MFKQVKIRARKLVMTVAALSALTAIPAGAHHSFSKFDMTKLTTITGTVREWTWANPHTWLMVTVRRSNGAVEQWALVGSSPNMMSRWGWKASDIKAGDRIAVDIHPGRDGSPIGAIQTVFLSKGGARMDPAGSTGQGLAGGPTKVPSKPQGQPLK